MDPVKYALAVSSVRIPPLSWHFGFYMPSLLPADPLDFWIAHALVVMGLRESGVL